MRERSCHPTREGLELRGRAARIDPDDVMGQAPEPSHGFAHLAGIPDLPAVGDDDDDGASRDAATAVLVEESCERRADESATALPAFAAAHPDRVAQEDMAQ